MKRLLPLLLLAACDTDNGQVTTWTDAAPVFEQHCVSCHRDGGIGPFELDDYELAKPWADAVVAATQVRQMPPYLVVDDGTCGDYAHDHWLTDAELGILADWAEDGAPEGDGATIEATPLPTLSGDLTRMKTPEFVPQIVGGAYAEFDEYRCFQFDIDSETDVFLTGFQVTPGNEGIVHHVVGMTVDPEAKGYGTDTKNKDLISALEAQDERAGWPCFLGAGDDVRNTDFLGWAPGLGAVEFPGGVGMKITAGTTLVFQVHYNLADPDTIGQSDTTSIDLRLEETPSKEAYLLLPDLFLGGYADQSSIAAGQSDAKVTFDLPWDWLIGDYPVDFEILNVSPHMHERGTQMYATMVRGDGSEECLFEVQRWDFNWQHTYWLDTPMRFNRDDTLKVECVYDTTDDTERILPGWGTQNEMCLPTMLITVGF